MLLSLQNVCKKSMHEKLSSSVRTLGGVGYA